MVLPGLTSTTTVHFSGPGEVCWCSFHTQISFIVYQQQKKSKWFLQVYSVRHDITNVQCLMPGLILAIRKVVRLKVFGKSNSVAYMSTQMDHLSNHKVFVAELDLWPGEVLVAIEFFARHKEETCTRNSRESSCV